MGPRALLQGDLLLNFGLCRKWRHAAGTPRWYTELLLADATIDLFDVRHLVTSDGGTKYQELSQRTVVPCPGALSLNQQYAPVNECLLESGIQEGLRLVSAMHITASVFINDDERGLHADYEKWLEGLAPHAPTSQYQHNRTGEDNADAHLKRQIMGRDAQR
jgi:hypothetical protein